jgi:hypothetical protein
MATVEFTRVSQGIFNTHALGSREKTAVSPKIGLFVYKSFAGRPGSSSDNFVPADWLISKLADAFHVSDTDLKKK